jgi:hypothetical protein
MAKKRTGYKTQAKCSAVAKTTGKAVYIMVFGREKKQGI